MSSINLYYGLFLMLVLSANAKFKVPEVSVEALSRGFRVSIPHVDGIVLFAFHGNLNKDIEDKEGGEFSVDIDEQENGRWTYTNKVKRLKVGDVINFWVYVDYFDGERKLGYIRDGETFTVTQLGGGITPPTVTTPTTSTGSVDCKYTETQVNGQRSCQGRLIFEENFGNTINIKWKREVKFAGDPDYSYVIYHNFENNLRLLNNKLHIKPSLTEDIFNVGPGSEINLGASCTGKFGTQECQQKRAAFVILPPVISAEITTKNYFSFRYGTIEIRAKLPQGDWIYPELFLRSKNEDYGPGLDSGLIRIAFTPGNLALSKTLSGGCVLGFPTPARKSELKTKQAQKRWTNDFHIYQLIWTPDKITLLADNETYGIISPPANGFADYATNLEIDSNVTEQWRQGGHLAPFDKEMYIVIGVGVGGRIFLELDNVNLPWDSDDPKAQYKFNQIKDTWKSTWGNHSTLVVDYVKVWSL